jgi:hypothetical protein
MVKLIHRMGASVHRASDGLTFSLKSKSRLARLGVISSTLPHQRSDCKRALGRKQRNLSTANRSTRLLLESPDQYLNQLVCGV